VSRAVDLRRHVGCRKGTGATSSAATTVTQMGGDAGLPGRAAPSRGQLCRAIGRDPTEGRGPPSSTFVRYAFSFCRRGRGGAQRGKCASTGKTSRSLSPPAPEVFTPTLDACRQRFGAASPATLVLASRPPLSYLSSWTIRWDPFRDKHMRPQARDLADLADLMERC
jgi:hypothetical protein